MDDDIEQTTSVTSTKSIKSHETKAQKETAEIQRLRQENAIPEDTIVVQLPTPDQTPEPDTQTDRQDPQTTIFGTNTQSQSLTDTQESLSTRVDNPLPTPLEDEPLRTSVRELEHPQTPNVAPQDINSSIDARNIIQKKRVRRQAYLTDLISRKQAYLDDLERLHQLPGYFAAFAAGSEHAWTVFHRMDLSPPSKH